MTTTVMTVSANSREQLVGDTEQREQRVDAAQRIGHAHQQDAAPRRGHGQAADPYARAPARVSQLSQRTAQVAQGVGEHETRDPGARIDGGQDEQRLEHDREVIPERLETGAAEDPVQHLGHAERQRRCSAGARHDRLFADAAGGLVDLVGGGRGPRQAETVDVVRRGAAVPPVCAPGALRVKYTCWSRIVMRQSAP